MSKESRKFIFIVNPSSGKKRLRNWEKIIAAHLTSPNYEILYTSYPGHSSSILSQYHSQQSDSLIIIAVGGDGTVSELIPTIIRSNSHLGIIPTGSGNGLARHLKIPLNTNKAIQKLNHGNLEFIDLIKVNEHYCCNTCGIGFTALVTKHFGIKGRRGFKTYFKLALALYKTSQSFDIQMNDKIFQNVWLVECANSSQLGNNAIVSPFASVNDGIADILILQKPKAWQIPAVILLVLSGNILKSRLSKLIKTTEVTIILKEEQDYHIDGEYMGQIKRLNIQMIPSAVQIIQ